MVLAVSSDSQMGRQVPEKDEIVGTDRANPYNYYLFTDAEIHGMNELELQVGDIYVVVEQVTLTNLILLVAVLSKSAEDYYIVSTTFK
ncbi:MAG: hypothetical protein MH321_11390 [Leptospiraceae bacterium]|nr:hypothetical protein [Leptospiraceae bacterium]